MTRRCTHIPVDVQGFVDDVFDADEDVGPDRFSGDRRLADLMIGRARQRPGGRARSDREQNNG